MTKYVTVYIPTHNRPVFLKRALESLAMQTYKRFQVGICDDGSTFENNKKINEIIEIYKPKFSDLFFIRNEKPLGACAARNKIINRADGDYITGLDDDDEFTKDRLQLFVESWTSDYSYLSSGHLTYDGIHHMKSPICLGQETTLEKLLYKNVVGNQVFTEKNNFKEIGGFDENMPAWQDYDMWIRMTKLYGAGFKINAHTYILNIAHELERITTSGKAALGAKIFIEKHKNILSESNIHSLNLQDLINRSSLLDWSFVKTNLDRNNAVPILKYYINRHMPMFATYIKKTLGREFGNL